MLFPPLLHPALLRVRNEPDSIPFLHPHTTRAVSSFSWGFQRFTFAVLEEILFPTVNSETVERARRIAIPWNSSPSAIQDRLTINAELLKQTKHQLHYHISYHDFLEGERVILEEKLANPKDKGRAVEDTSAETIIVVS